MVTNELNVSDGGRYPIGIAADILGINRSTLLRHTKQGLIKCGFSRANARRFYLGRELKRYWLASY
jgi:predicted site-specific integrase-resolvase